VPFAGAQDEKGKISDFDDRWKWIEEGMLPAYKDLHGTKPEDVKAAMEQYIKKANKVREKEKR
jgi:hypothetical protein